MKFSEKTSSPWSFTASSDGSIYPLHFGKQMYHERFRAGMVPERIYYVTASVFAHWYPSYRSLIILQFHLPETLPDIIQRLQTANLSSGLVAGINRHLQHIATIANARPQQCFDYLSPRIDPSALQWLTSHTWWRRAILQSDRFHMTGWCQSWLTGVAAVHALLRKAYSQKGLYI